MANLSEGLEPIIFKIGVFTTKKTFLWAKHEQLKLPLIPTFPMCHIFDLHDYFDLENNTPLQIYIDALNIKGIFSSIGEYSAKY